MSKISSLQTEFESGDAKTSLKTTHKTTIIQILIWGALCGAMVYLNKVAALYMWKKADAIGANNMPLFDTFHDLIQTYLPWLEDLPNYVLWLPDYFAGASMMLFCSTLVLNPKRLEVFRWYLQIMTIVLFMRATTIVSTLVPTPIRPCIGPELPRVPGLSQDASFWFPSGSMFCNDQMFSGHTTVNTISISFFLLSHSKSYWGWRMVGFCHLFMALVTTLATHDHYMMDILVGLYISSAVVFGFRREIQKVAVTTVLVIAND